MEEPRNTTYRTIITRCIVALICSLTLSCSLFSRPLSSSRHLNTHTHTQSQRKNVTEVLVFRDGNDSTSRAHHSLLLLPVSFTLSCRVYLCACYPSLFLYALSLTDAVLVQEYTHTQTSSSNEVLDYDIVMVSLME